MPLLYNRQTGVYYNATLEDLKALARMQPQLNAQNVRVNGVGAIGVYGTTTPNLLVIPKTGTVNIWVGYGIFSGGLDGYQKVQVAAGQPIGITTGTTGDWASTTEVKLTVALGGGKYKAGQPYYIYTPDLEFKASSGGGSTGGDIMFPIAQGSKNSAVKEFQQWLIKCGANLGSWGADGEWGGATNTAALGKGITRINSRAELEEILKRPCTSGGGGGGGGGGVVVDPNPTPTPTPGATDNTALWVVGGIGGAIILKKIMGGKKKKKKKKRG